MEGRVVFEPPPAERKADALRSASAVSVAARLPISVGVASIASEAVLLTDDTRNEGLSGGETGTVYDHRAAEAPVHATAADKAAPVQTIEATKPQATTTGSLELGCDADGRKVTIDLPELIAGRLLVTGNSGAGKSWLLRRLLEQTWGLVQQVVVDPEGEFVTLAEGLGHVVMAPRRDAATGYLFDAGLRLREHRVSAVLDLSELDRNDQVDAAASLLNGLLMAPREHWHAVLVAVDEAHLFAPHGPTGDVDDDVRKASLAAMADLMARGRKRGLCGIPATQRLARLAKVVAAEPTNFLVGRTLLDLDVARAAELLGWERKSAERLRDLRPGSFVAFGPSLAVRATVVRIGEVSTTHLGATPALTPPPACPPDKALELVLPPPTKGAEPAGSLDPAPTSLVHLSVQRLPSDAALAAAGPSVRERFDILRPLLERETAPATLVDKQAAIAGVAASTIQRWLRQYRQRGLDALTDHRRRAPAPPC